MYGKPTAQIKQMKKNSKHFHSDRTRTSTFPLLFNIVFEVLARLIREVAEIKGIQLEREAIKVSLFTDVNSIYKRP